MTNVVEDGTGLSNANTYITVAFADDYFTERNIIAWSGTNAEKEAFILRATDYIELVFGYRFIGSKFLATQALEHPRIADDGTSLGVPLNLKKACAEYALIAKNSSLIINPDYSADGMLVTEISKEVTGIKKSVKFDVNQLPIQIRPYPTADIYLKSLLYSVQAGLIRN
jgi:hypothetical protein